MYEVCLCSLLHVHFSPVKTIDYVCALKKGPFQDKFKARKRYFAIFCRWQLFLSAQILRRTLQLRGSAGPPFFSALTEQPPFFHPLLSSRCTFVEKI